MKKYRNRLRFFFLTRYGYILCDKTVHSAVGPVSQAVTRFRKSSNAKTSNNEIFGKKIPLLTPLSPHGKILFGGVRRRATPENVALSMCYQSLKVWWQSHNSKWSKNQGQKNLSKNSGIPYWFINKLKTT